jgi:hypothetical protein
MLVLAACGQSQQQVILPTNTPDPLAFFVPTPVSPGRAQNPLRVVFVPRTDVTLGETSNASAPTTTDTQPADGTPAAAPPTNEGAIDIAGAIATLDTELEARSGLTVEVLAVPSDGEAMSLLCDYDDEDRFAAVWLSGPSAVLAISRECGAPALVGARAGRTRLAGHLISSSGVSLRGLPNRTYCRLGRSDFYSWILPSLAMEADGINPTSIAKVDNYVNYNLLLGGITDGSCGASGVPAGFLDLDMFSEFSDRIAVTNTLTAMPYGVLIYPPELLLGDRVALTEAFLEIAATEATPTDDETTPLEPELVTLDTSTLTTPQLSLLTLLGAEGVQETSLEDLADVFAFMESTNIDLNGDMP